MKTLKKKKIVDTPTQAQMNITLLLFCIEHNV